MSVPFTQVSADDRHDAVPRSPSGGGVLLLAGSSGRIEAERAELLAAEGIRTRAIRWFGGVRQRPAPHEVPLELFAGQLDVLRRECDRVSILGTSFGGEAALLTATVTAVDAVIAVSPSSVVWGGMLDGSWSSHWTHDGRRVPWVPFAEDWRSPTDPPEYLSLYRTSLDRDAAVAEAAAIPVERIASPVLLTAGGDDRVWPSTMFADAIARRRAAHGLPTEVLSSEGAGHRLVLPGEVPATGGTSMRRGGDETSDRALGARVWPRLRSLLR